MPNWISTAQFINPEVSQTLIRWYTLNNTLNDGSGNGYTLSLASGTKTYVSDVNGIAKFLYSSNGINYTTTNGALAINNSYSFCTWWKGDTGSSNLFTIYADDNGTGLTVDIGSPTNWGISTRSATNATSFSNTHGMSENIWYHVVLTFDYAGKEVKFYRNGVYINNATAATMYWSAGTTTAPHYLGNAQGSNMGSGTIGDIRVYSGVLTANDIAAIYKYLA